MEIDMKKLLAGALVALTLCGCGSKAVETKTATCTNTTKQNGLKMDITTKFDYQDKTVVKQTQDAVITAKDKDTYAFAKQYMEGTDMQNSTKDMKGVTYELKYDEEKFQVTEIMSIDFTKISADDYNKVTNGQANIDGKRFKIDLDKTISGMKTSGFKCEL